MKSNRATQEPRWVRYGLLTIGLGFLFFFLGLPLVAVFVEALAQGVPLYIEALKEPETRSAIWLTRSAALLPSRSMRMSSGPDSRNENPRAAWSS